MHEPSVRGSRLAIAAGLAAVLIVGGTGFLVGRETAPKPRIVSPAPARQTEPTPAPTEAPVDRPAWGRSQLLGLIGEAADASASGEPLPEKIAQAAGRRFDLVLPFGCAGPSAEGSRNAMGWRLDEAKGVVRVYAKPESWTPDEWRLPSSAESTLKGFWIPRPWSSSAECPAQVGQTGATGSEPVTLPGQTLAIAQTMPSDAQWRTFEKVERVEPDEIVAAAGFRLRLSGKIDSFPDGGPIRCIQPAGPEQRPLCVLAARFEEVRIENAATGEVLGVWDERALQR